MIVACTDNLVALVKIFTYTYYSLVADVASGINLVFILPDFDPKDESMFAPLVGVQNYCFIIANPTVTNEVDAPWNGLKIRYRAKFYVIRKTAEHYDVTTRANRATQGDKNPEVTALHSVCANLAKYLRKNKIANCYWNDITEVEDYGRVGQFNYIPCTFEALRMEPTTIS